MPFDGVESEVTERLVIGRARIEAGWCQNQLLRTIWTRRGRHREYCLIGAVDLWGWSIGGYAANDLLTLAITELGYGRGSGPWPVSEFNDRLGRTKAEVLDVLDLAIAMSRGEYPR